MTHAARGEVWWRETLTHGRRPYIMLTRDEAVNKLAELIVVPMTTTVRDLPKEVLYSAKMEEVCRALNATVAC